MSENLAVEDRVGGALPLRRIGVAIGILWAVLSAHPARAGAEVRSLSLTVSEKDTAFTVKMSRPTAYKVFTLEHPRRVVIDLKDTWRAHSAHLPAAEGMVRDVRAGVRPHRGLRLVLELKSNLRTHVRWSVRPGEAPRLIVTLGAEAALTARDVPLAVVAHVHAHPRRVPADSNRAQPVLSTHVPVPDSLHAAAVPAAPATAAAPDQPVHVAHAPIDSGRDVVIAVDAGHGGQDSGAIGRGGIAEKNVVLAIARALARRIDAEPGMRAVLTRDRDEFLPLRERMRRARAARADLFVSIHADSIPASHVSGSSVYVLSERGATDEAARWVAERENAADSIGGVSLADKDPRLASVLLDMVQSASISASMTAAERVLTELKRVGEVHKQQVQQAGFVVLKAPDIPSMLIETAYISNPRDERRLRSASQQRELAEAIFTGLHAYFEEYPPAGTRVAHQRAIGTGSAVLAGAYSDTCPRSACSPRSSSTR